MGPDASGKVASPLARVPDRTGTRAVSEHHRFDEASLARWLSANLPGWSPPMTVRQFVGGQSNPTFHLSCGSGEYVLRKRPTGTLLAGAHAINREYRVMAALTDSDVPVPQVRVYCDDAGVIGTPFYVMDYQPGRIFTDPLLPGLEPAERARIYDAMNDAVARLHGFDWRGHQLTDFGKPAAYVERQVKLWRRQHEAISTSAVPVMDRLADWLAANIPDDDSASIVHGDYRLGNLIFDEQEARVVAILDWELSTIGHPLCDLAFNAMSYHLPVGHAVAPGFVGADIAGLGIPSEQDYVEAYARRTGRATVPDWKFYMAFSLYRVAAIQCGVYQRALSGTASSDTAALFGDSYRMVADAGWKVVAGN